MSPEKERDRARRVYGQSGDASVNPFKPTLSAMSVACMRPKSAYSLDCCRQPAQDFPHVVDDLLREIGTIRGNPQRFPDGPYKPPMSLRWGSGRPNSSRIERHMLSTVEHAAVTASSGSYSALSSARSKSRRTVSKSRTSALSTSSAITCECAPAATRRMLCPRRCRASPSWTRYLLR